MKFRIFLYGVLVWLLLFNSMAYAYSGGGGACGGTGDDERDAERDDDDATPSNDDDNDMMPDDDDDDDNNNNDNDDNDTMPDDDDDDDNDTTPGDDDTTIEEVILDDVTFAPMSIDQATVDAGSFYLMDGGNPGLEGTSLARSADGANYVAAIKGGWLIVYSWNEKAIAREVVATTPYLAEVAVDSRNHLHVVYWDTANQYLTVATNASGEWIAEPLVQILYVSYGRLRIAVDSADRVHVAFFYQAGITYGTNASGEWETEYIAMDEIDLQGDLAVDNAGNAYLSCGHYNLNYLTNASGEWEQTRVASGYEHEEDRLLWATTNSIALDSEGFPHLNFARLYYHIQSPQFYSGWLGHATNSSGSWALEQISEVQVYPAQIRMDARDKIHVVYEPFETKTAPLELITDAGGDWTTTIVTMEEGRSSSFVLGEDGKAFISYRGNELELFSSANDRWDKTVIDDAKKGGLHQSLALDADGNVYLAFCDAQTKKLNLATDRSGSWEKIDLGMNTGQCKATSIAVDAAGRVHVGYVDEISGDARYLTDDSGDWAFVSFAAPENCTETSLAVEADGRVHFSFTDGDLWVATPADRSSVWTVERLEDGCRVIDTAIAVDAWGHSHIGYNCHSNGEVREIKYATDLSGSWVVSEVDAQSNANRDLALALDSSGKVHLAYHDAALGLLKYATNAAGDWQFEIVDDSDFAQLGLSLALDADGYAHLAYHGKSDYWADFGRKLHYATNCSGNWETTTLARFGNVAAHTGLAVDSDGAVHLTYNGNDALWYANLAAAGKNKN